MLSNINMEFIQALNPLYAVPIVAVVFCALIVYTLGFKSPIQPPSFEGLDEVKKFTKKRKTKDVQKQNKLVTNGKVNGIATTKGKQQEVPKKKEVVDNKMNEKLRSDDKTFADKKAVKKVKLQNEKQQEKKKGSGIIDELNDDGWVQHISKKGKKNRKKEDHTSSETQSNSNQFPFKNTIEIGDFHVVDKVSQNHIEVSNEEKKEILEEKPLKKSSKKETISIPRPEVAVKLEIAVEVKPDESFLEQDLKLSTTNIPIVSEDTNKSKKKKKKDSTSAVVEACSESILPNITDQPIAPLKITEPVIDKVPVSMAEDSKSNVVFDELAGLYPEAKEKKKKKVRRDH